MDRSFITRVSGGIESFLAEFTADRGIFPVDIVVRGQRNNIVVEVYVDGRNGVDTATCAEISRALGKALDAGPLSGEAYALTVSSPGLDRPLKYAWQYPKHVGRGIVVRLASGGGKETIRGLLVSADAEGIVVRTGAKEDPRLVPFDHIGEARIEPRW